MYKNTQGVQPSKFAGSDADTATTKETFPERNLAEMSR
jgi:hypothetical protein